MKYWLNQLRENAREAVQQSYTGKLPQTAGLCYLLYLAREASHKSCYGGVRFCRAAVSGSITIIYSTSEVVLRLCRRPPSCRLEEQQFRSSASLKYHVI